MPRATLSTSRLFTLLGRPLTEDELKEALFRTKVEAGDFHDGTVDVEVNADRLDLLEEGGLAWDLQGALGLAKGLPGPPLGTPRPGLEARVNPSVAPLRSELAMAVAVAPEGRALDAGTLEALVPYQELLHATLGRDRASASLGMYPLERLRPPFHYAMEPLGQVRFVPLGGTEEMDGPSFYSTHPMAQRYGTLGRRDDLGLTLRDDARTVLSLPPVLNASGAGEIKVGDREVLIESTGTRPARTREMVGYMLVPFMARGWTVHPVPVHAPSGPRDGQDVVAPRSVPVPLAQVASLLGARLSASEVEQALLEARLGVERSGGVLRAQVPPWRADLLAPVDLLEEVAIARGYSSFAPILPPSTSMGHRRPERLFRARLGDVLLGMGYQELHTQVLLSRAAEERTSPPGDAIALRNPISAEYAVARTTVRSALMESLAHNTRSGYPQRFFEVGPVIVRDPGEETGTRTEVHLALVDAEEGAGFARAAAVAERLFAILGFPCPREPAAVQGSVPGRVARLRIAGEPVALLGEIHPEVLTELKLTVPVSFVELDLSRLERLKQVSVG